MLYVFLLGILSVLLYLYLKRRFNYWKDLGVPTLSPNFLFGDVTQCVLGRKNLSVAIKDAYDEFKRRGCKFGGMYIMGRPIFLPVGTDVVKSIIVKDFDHFTDRGVYYEPVTDPMSGNLFSIPGDAWRKIRQKVTPTYTSGKLKAMFPKVAEKTDILCKVMGKECGKDTVFVHTFARYGIDIISDVAFGVECNALESTEQKFYDMACSLFQPTKKELINLILTEDLSNPGKFMKLMTAKKQLCSFFTELVNETVQHRRENNVRSNDFLQYLVDLQDADEINSLTMQQVAAQSFLFFVAAFETSSKALSFTMYSLAKDKTLQDTLRAEINQALEKNNGKFDYEMVMQNKLLDMVFKETLRKYPPITHLHRECVKDYQIPDTNVTLKKGTLVLFSVLGTQNHPDNFSEPEIYDPYRFEDPENIKPYTYFPFGEGPRNCIGNRFGMMQVKLGIAKLVHNFEFSLGPKTPEPLEFNPLTENLLYTIKGDIHFNLKRVATT